MTTNGKHSRSLTSPKLWKVSGQTYIFFKKFKIDNLCSEADFDDLIPLVEKDLEDAKLKKSKKAKKQETEQPVEQESEQME